MKGVCVYVFFFFFLSLPRVWNADVQRHWFTEMEALITGTNTRVMWGRQSRTREAPTGRRVKMEAAGEQDGGVCVCAGGTGVRRREEEKKKSGDRCFRGFATAVLLFRGVRIGKNPPGPRAGTSDGRFSFKCRWKRLQLWLPCCCSAAHSCRCLSAQSCGLRHALNKIWSGLTSEALWADMYIFIYVYMFVFYCFLCDYSRLIRYLSFCVASLIHVTRRTQRLWQLGVDDHVMIFYVVHEISHALSPAFAVYSLALHFSHFSF